MPSSDRVNVKIRARVRPQLRVGQQVKLDGARTTWTVQAVTGNFTCLVQQVPFKPRGELQYTVIDWTNDIRGACNLIGNGYGDGTYSREQCSEMLAAFERYRSGAHIGSGDEPLALEVSHRNRVPLGTVEVVS